MNNFDNFPHLEILDLNLNHLSNWFERVFTNNNKLRIVNLRTNNINLMTPAMMSDFSLVSFLAIGANNFVCDCSLREFIDRAAFNAMYYQCNNNNQRMKRSTSDDEPSTFGFDDPAYYYDVFTRKFHKYVEYIEESYQNILGVEINLMSRRQVVPSAGCNEIKNKNVDSNMNFNFLLLDYSENDYHCVKSNGQAKSKGKAFRITIHCLIVAQ